MRFCREASSSPAYLAPAHSLVASIGTLTFKPGETCEDDHDRSHRRQQEGADETFYLDLFGNSSNSLFTKNRGVGTILNDD